MFPITSNTPIVQFECPHNVPKGRSKKTFPEIAKWLVSCMQIIVSTYQRNDFRKIKVKIATKQLISGIYNNILKHCHL